MADSYTAWQMYDSLLRQGYDEEQALAMAQAIGGSRKTPEVAQRGLDAIGAGDAQMPTGRDGEQDSSLTPNMGDGLGTLAGLGAAHKLGYTKALPDDASFLQKAGKFGKVGGLSMAGGLAGTLGSLALTGNNFYDRGSDNQILADIGGGMAGAYLGERYGGKLGGKAKGKVDAAGDKARKLGRKVAPTVEKAAGSKVVEKWAPKAVQKGLGTAATRLAGGTLGRGIGSAVGALGGPLGAAAGTILGGWLVPKLFSDGSSSVEEDDEDRKKYRNPF